MKRTHDKFYIKEAQTAPVKEAFKLIVENIADFDFNENDNARLGDMGCAAGVLPNFIKSNFENIDVIGYEYLEELLATARKVYPNINFEKVDVTDSQSLKPQSLDIITMSGVLSIFDNAEKIISNLLNWIRPGGRILIFNLFNAYDYDVFIKYKHSRETMEDGLESGWNIISQKSVSLYLEKQGIKKYEFIKFTMPFDIKKNNEDYIRSWTEKDADSSRYITNGLNIKQPFHLLKIDV